MPTIVLVTEINAPIETVFNLSRSIDLHMESTKQTGERAISGKTSGLFELGETVTWRAKHFGIWQTLTSEIIEFDFPNSFSDEMTEGAFKSMRHEHLFFAVNDQTVMKDIFVFELPYGIFGEFVNFVFLGRYMTKLLRKRNKVIKEAAESDH